MIPIVCKQYLTNPDLVLMLLLVELTASLPVKGWKHSYACCAQQPNYAYHAYRKYIPEAPELGYKEQNQL